RAQHTTSLHDALPIYPGRGADASDYFYRIETVDAANNVANSTSLAVKVRLAFAAGLNLLGMPVDLTDPTFGGLAAGRMWADAWTDRKSTRLNSSHASS